jgi:hypothetical protein
MSSVIPLAAGVNYADLHFGGHPGIIATVLLHGVDGVAVVDPGPSTSLPVLEAALRQSAVPDENLLPDDWAFFKRQTRVVLANSGKIDHFLFGRNEPALHHFHNNYRSALGMPPLEEPAPGDMPATPPAQ